MAAGDQVAFHCRYLKHPDTAISGIRLGRITPTVISSEAPGDASYGGGPADISVNSYRIDVEAYGIDPNALRALVGAAAANAVFGYKGAAGANEKHTLKNVMFTRFLGAIEMPDPDAGGVVQLWGVAGTAEWGDADNLAAMWVTATDA